MNTKTTTYTQLDAVDAAINGTFIDRARIARHAMRELVKDPEQTENVFLLALSVNRGSLGDLIEQFAETESGDWLLTNKPAIDSAHVDHDYLRSLDDGTLGREYIRFLDDNELDSDFFQAPPGLPPILSFIGQRMRQSHDIWHTVTGYTPEPAGEIELQAFTYAQINVPSSALLALVGTLRGAREVPGLAMRVFRAYRRGKRAAKLAPVIWESRWEHTLEDIRRELDIS